MSLFEYNRNIFVLALEGYSRKVVMPMLTNVCEEAATTMLDTIDQKFRPFPEKYRQLGGTVDYPVYSGNLRDSTGLAVYCDGAVRSYKLPKYATHPQHIGKQGGIWGAEELESAIDYPGGEFFENLWVILFSAVDYAMIIDNGMSFSTGRGQNYFGKLQAMFVQAVKDGLDSRRISYGINNIDNPEGEYLYQ